jgi:hypothetical protein
MFLLRNREIKIMIIAFALLSTALTIIGFVIDTKTGILVLIAVFCYVCCFLYLQLIAIERLENCHIT